MAHELTITARPSADGWLAEVTVRDGARATRHSVRVPDAAWRSLTGGRASVEELLEASFRFLLEREPPESILRAFEVTVIPRYFPEYERAMRAKFRA